MSECPALAVVGVGQWEVGGMKFDVWPELAKVLDDVVGGVVFIAVIWIMFGGCTR